MCRALGDKKPRRCPNCTPSRRRAFQRARYSLKKGKRLHPVNVPAEAPVVEPAAPETDLTELIRSVRIVAGSIFREDHKDESAEDNFAFQQRRQAANSGLKEAYGSIDQAAIAVGSLVAARAEELSGTSPSRYRASQSKPAPAA